MLLMMFSNIFAKRIPSTRSLVRLYSVREITESNFIPRKDNGNQFTYIDTNLEKDVIKEKEIITDLMNNPSGMGLFSTFSNKTNNKKYPISFLVNYNIDFDGKPFFRMDSKSSCLDVYLKNILSSPTSSLNIYGFTSSKNQKVINNLVMYGKSKNIYEGEDTDRLDWIIKNDNKDLSSSNTNIVNDRMYSYNQKEEYKYFKMIEIDQIELISTGSEVSKYFDNSLFNFIKPKDYLKDFKINDVRVMYYINNKYKEVLLNIVRNNLFLSKDTQKSIVEDVFIININQSGLSVSIRYYNIDSGDHDKIIDIPFSRNINKFDELYSELELMEWS